MFIGGAGVARGYLNRPELTAERFLQSPFDASDRLYRSGDLVRLRDDRQIEFVGRADDQVKIRGFRVELGEVEEALRRSPAVRDAVVITMQPEAGPLNLVGYLVGDADSVDTDAVRGFLRKAFSLSLLSGAKSLSPARKRWFASRKHDILSRAMHF